jgi:F0F1-type ATP synthase assembly protein I
MQEANSSSAPQKKKHGNPFTEALQLFWELGFIIALPVALFAFGGAFLDRFFHTSPLFLLVGIALALAASGMGVYRMIQRVNDDQNAENAEQNR